MLLHVVTGIAGQHSSIVKFSLATSQSGWTAYFTI